MPLNNFVVLLVPSVYQLDSVIATSQKDHDPGWHKTEDVVRFSEQLRQARDHDLAYLAGVNCRLFMAFFPKFVGQVKKESCSIAHPNSKLTL